MSDPVRPNDFVVLIGGKSSTGKSTSLMQLENPEGVLYLNCDAGKKLPFNSKFNEKTITDPYEIYSFFEAAEAEPRIHTIVIDTLTFMMDMMESVHVITSGDQQKAWGHFSQFFKVLMQHHVARSTKRVIFCAHTAEPSKPGDIETYVQVKSSLKNNGIEAYFAIVIATKKLPLRALAGYESPLLTITPEEEALGYKYVFQTRLTKETVHERIRGPLGLFSTKETFIDNNLQLVLDRLKTYYK